MNFVTVVSLCFSLYDLHYSIYCIISTNNQDSSSLPCPLPLLTIKYFNFNYYTINNISLSPITVLLYLAHS